MKIMIKRTAILASLCAALLCGGIVQMYAADIAGVEQSTRKITGTVIDETGEAVIGASILEKGTTNGTITDFEGNFRLDVKPGATLVVSYIGYSTQEVKVGNMNNVRVTMQEDSENLDEVVVVGYGVQKKKLVTGATVQVKGEQLAKLNTTSAIAAMQSSTPGVQITSNSNQPGKDFKVNIRGLGTTGTATPLYVIDGVSGGDLSNVNPADIESIDVLKDAASAAIYGARAANGVILVTTKQGKQGKTEVSYDGFYGISNVYKRVPTLNAQEYMQLADEANFNAFGETINWAAQMPADIYQKIQNGWTGTDWYGEMINENATQQNHAVNVTGGNERSTFSLGFSYTGNEGTMGYGDLVPTYDRYTGRINSEHIILKGADRDIVKVGENVSFYYNDTQNGMAETNIYWNNVHSTIVTAPLTPVYDEAGNLYDYNTYGAGWNGLIFGNPIAGYMNGQYNSINESRNFGVGATAYLVVEPVKDLVWRSQANVGYSANYSRNYGEPYSNTSTNVVNNYSLQEYYGLGSSWQFENTITYKFPEFAGNKFDAMIGNSLNHSGWGRSAGMQNTTTEENKLSTMTGWSHAFITNFGTNYDNASMTSAPWGDSGLVSFFGRLNWNYKETFMATAIFRRDGSSNFARGHRWSNFPSFSAGWVVSNHDFMAGAKDWMDFLKIRASWGQNGNHQIAPFQYLSSIAYTGSFYDNSYIFDSSIEGKVKPSPVSGAFSPRLPNPVVTWETSEQLDLGLDARFFGSRLGVAFDWYNKATKDWLVQAPVLSIYGTDAPFVNGGAITNRGVELALTWNDQVGKDFSYNIGVNGAYNKNTVTEIANADGILYGPANVLSQSTDYIYRAEVGYPIGYFYGMSSKGIWQTQEQIDAARAAGEAVYGNPVPGDVIWEDYDNDGTINYDLDRHMIGDPNPDVRVGLNLGFNYKALDFSVTGYGAFGQQIMRNYRSIDSNYNNYTQVDFQRWHGNGTSNTMPRLFAGSHTNTQWISDIYMENGNYFKVQNVTLGFDFARIWKQNYFNKLRLYAQAQNLFTFTKYTGVDPEIGSSAGYDVWASGIDLGLYPSARTYLIGVSVVFADGKKAQTPVVTAPVYTGEPEVRYVEKEVVKEVVKEVPGGTKTADDALYFVIGKSELQPGEAFKLGKICQIMIDNPDAKISIDGYADSATGTEEINDQLSRARAKVVADKLIAEGISPLRITTAASIDKDKSASPEENRVAICIVK